MLSKATTVVHLITQLELGGAQEATLFVCEQLAQRRWQVHLITGPGGILDTEASQIPNLRVDFEPLLIREIRPLTDLRCVISLTERFRRIQREHPGPMIVHTHGSKAGILGRWAAWRAGGNLRVHSVHGFGFHNYQPWLLRRGLQATEQITANVTDAFCPVSEANRVVAERLGLLREGKQVVMLPSGIEATEYEPASEDRIRVRREIGIPSQAPVAGMIACLKPQKCPRDFVLVAARVLEEVPDAHFFIAGDGVLRAEVEAEISAHGIEDRFHLLGWQRDIRSLLGVADLLVLTSLWEGLPRVCLQAMAAKKPMVATRVDGIPEAIQDGINGFLLEPHDVNGFAERITHLLRHPLTAESMGDAGKSHLARFNKWSMLDELETLYEHLLKKEALAQR